MLSESEDKNILTGMKDFVFGKLIINLTRVKKKEPACIENVPTLMCSCCITVLATCEKTEPMFAKVKEQFAALAKVIPINQYYR